MTQFSVTNASALDCPAGGKVYSLFIDANNNGIQDPAETSLSSQTVCNGLNGVKGDTGDSGYNALLATNRVTTNFDSCPSGSGLQISYGLDADRSGGLDATEITKTEILCDGKDGETGAAGLAGSNGHSIVFTALAADTAICPAGGVTTLMALDIHDTGAYSSLDPNQYAMTICNGENGQDGQNAALSAYTPVDVIMPCGNNAAYKEILLRLFNGQLLASFSDDASGKNTRLSLLPDGSYVDTDSSQCTFTVSTSGHTRSISWSGHVQQSWSIQ